MQTKNWHIKESNQKLCVKLSDQLKIDPTIIQLLLNRGLNTENQIQQFLNSDISKMHDPFLFKNMDRVVERIQKAKEAGERVLVFGDYDVDGVTSSALLNKTLIAMDVDVIHHIPHRHNDGYGLNHEIAEYAKEQGASLLITVDCGITAVEEIETINKLGIDVIVVDHHEPGHEDLPDAYAIINPKQKGCMYPFKELAAVGLALKLSQALTDRVDQEALHLASIGTVADVAPLVDENRIIVKEGLNSIHQTRNKGLLALMKASKIINKRLSPYHIGFILGPRINAAGRMDTAHTSLDLFLSETDSEAEQLAQELNQHNYDRQKTQKEVIEQALEIVGREEISKDKVIVLNKQGWHKGVLGIVASRLTDKYSRPSIVISVEEGVGTASARSIDGFHIHDAIASCGEYLEAFGGHAGAAGLTIREENIDPFRSMINEIADQTLEIKKLIPSVHIDGEINISDVTLSLAQTIDDLQPFGEGNPMPIFCARNCIVKSNPQILGKETLKFWVTDQKASISVVGFGMAKYSSLVKLGQKVDLAFHITIDDWNKAPTPQFQLKDIRLSEK